MLDAQIAYKALLSHDRRFDGIFFVGVLSTGIYCRPICPAKTPKFESCRFFNNKEAAEKALFRPCLRCRPEIAPGKAPVDNSERLAHSIANHLEDKLITNEQTLEEIAATYNLSSRHLRRIIKKEFGVSPIELLQTRRLLLAKQLLTDTSLSIIRIAFASGFSSLRRFNDAFQKHYKMPPTKLRKLSLPKKNEIKSLDMISLELGYRPPYDWPSMLEFLEARKIVGVEHINHSSYLRTVCIAGHKGWIEVSHLPQKNSLRVKLTASLIPVLSILLTRLRNLFDLNANINLINEHLIKDEKLRASIEKNPGLRVPGAFDNFEMIVRAILGQQITVRAATTLASRYAKTFGEKIETNIPELNLLTPDASILAKASIDELATLGIISARAKTILAFSELLKDKPIFFNSTHPEDLINQLITIPGIGPWTANYITMRAFRWPNAFLKEDIAMRKNLGHLSAKEAEELSKAWQPWRSYALMHIWKNVSVIN
ncbi:MAG: helix-turn-helix domain-containing protein [Proteobacteria bacterium]|nr:helix-turn-helix domain-containing protein [Pseudomonadota bacterium]